MHSGKQLIIGGVAFLLIFSAPFGGETAPSSAKQSSAPIVIEADQLYFSDSTGNLTAKGNVQVVQNNQKMVAQELQGNTKMTEVWIDDKATFSDPTVKAQISGLQTKYNYGNQTGRMSQISGEVGRQLVTANSIEILPHEFILHKGSMTSCPAQVPDYHVSADKVEIWPGNKLIAYNAKFWIKNTVIFSLAKYQKSLDENDSKSDFPQVDYTSSDGFSIKQYFEYPLSDKVAFFSEPAWYSKQGYKPVYGIINRENLYTTTLSQGYFRDSDGNWIEKEPELRFSYKARRLGSLPVNYTFTAVYGKWTDATKSSWHQDYLLYFRHDPIQLNPSLTLNVGTGYQVRKESYDASTIGAWRFNTSLHKTWSPNLGTWMAYNYTSNNANLFNYEKIDVANELVYGINYKLDRLNTFSFHQSYDVQNNRVFENYYTWNRNLHCWQMSLQYKVKEQKWEWNLSTIRW